LEDEAAPMNCVICKHGETAPGHTTVTTQRGECTVIIRSVPADVCANCGEYYLAEAIAQRVFEMAQDAVKKGAEVEIRRFAA
jgi:YgiT-type zinc finger domain-containing protein